MLNGKWNINLVTPLGNQATVADLTVEDGVITGTMIEVDGTIIKIFDGSIEDDEFTWAYKMKAPMPMKFVIKGTFEGEKIVGTSKAAMGTAKFVGVKVE